MSNTILILGDSGTGKSTSLRNLDPTKTFIINILDKPLPFRGYKSNYTKLSADGLTGNYYETDDHTKIMRVIKLVNDKRPEIINLIIDDFGFTMTNTYMRRSREKGYDKFIDIGRNAWEMIGSLRGLREDLNCVITMHVDIDVHGKCRPKTIGKMIDGANIIEGSFTYVFQSIIVDNKYKFITANDGQHMAKTPMGCFEEFYVDNDLNEILHQIENYNLGDYQGAYHATI
jgi:hypothetical protein